MPPRNAAEAPNFEQAFAELAVAVRGLLGSQTQFMRSAAEADPSIGTSLSTPLLPSEELEARAIDNTVEDDHRNGLPAARQDHRPLMPDDYVYDPDDDDYDPQTIIVTAPTGVTVTTKSHLSAQTSSLLGTELEAAISEVSTDYYLQTVI